MIVQGIVAKKRSLLKCLDCRGVPFGTSAYDQLRRVRTCVIQRVTCVCRCDVCNGNNTCSDCFGVPYGSICCVEMFAFTQLQATASTISATCALRPTSALRALIALIAWVWRMAVRYTTGDEASACARVDDPTQM
jgi:hypothetical protein